MMQSVSLTVEPMAQSLSEREMPSTFKCFHPIRAPPESEDKY